jgi:hypothetical protein
LRSVKAISQLGKKEPYTKEPLKANSKKRKTLRLKTKKSPQYVEKQPVAGK